MSWTLNDHIVNINPNNESNSYLAHSKENKNPPKNLQNQNIPDAIQNSLMINVTNFHISLHKTGVKNDKIARREICFEFKIKDTVIVSRQL